MRENTLSYEIIRSARRTIAIQITPQGRVLVRCPKNLGTEQIRKFVESKSTWILKHLAAQTGAAQAPCFTGQQIENFAHEARRVIPQRVAELAPLVGVSYGKITIRCQHTRWGSCSSKGNLNFNCLLMLVPPEVLDYVIVHELCHRKEMNHSERFWAEVQRILPDYQKQRAWLKTHGRELIGRLP